MAKISSIQKNKKRQKLSQRHSEKRKALKDKIYDKGLSLEERFSYIQKLSKIPRNSSMNRIRNRCGVTGRPRGYVRKMGLSRIMVRKMAGEGLLPGMVKASW